MDQVASQPNHAKFVSPAQVPVGKLGLISHLLFALNDNGIRYCHWKSNEHLDASMTGDTDLDVLFDLAQKSHLEEILAAIGFKKFTPAKQRQYKDIEDYIGLDVASGRIVHLHTHFKLSIGEINLKSYQLDFEEIALSSRIYDEEFGLYRTHPAFELILLYYRQAFKLRTRDKFNIRLKGDTDFKVNIIREYEWLRERCSDDEVATFVNAISADEGRELFDFVTGRFNKVHLAKLAGFLKRRHKNQRLYSPLQATLLRWFREFYLKAVGKYSRLVNNPMVVQRTNPRGGLAIAIVGADGSGKSTVVKNLQSTFKRKLDVCNIYFGKGGGRVSWYRKMLLGFKKKFDRSKRNFQQDQIGFQERISGGKKVPKPGRVSVSTYRCIEALMVASEKLSNLKRMQLAKKRGMLVICDRFPQNQIFGYNDGPTLQHWQHSKNIFLKAIAKREATIYEQFDKNTPDLVFKLIARAEVVEARKPGETSLDILRKKIDGVKQLQYPENCKVVIVNAEDPLERVLCIIKKSIWEAYP